MVSWPSPASHCWEVLQVARWLSWEPPAGTSEQAVSSLVLRTERLVGLGWPWTLSLLALQDLQLWQVASCFQMCWISSQGLQERLGQEMALNACAMEMLGNGNSCRADPLLGQLRAHYPPNTAPLGESYRRRKPCITLASSWDKTGSFLAGSGGFSGEPLPLGILVPQLPSELKER